MQVLDIHVLVYHDDELGEHHQHHAPDGAHNLFRLARIAFFDGDNDDVVEAAFDGHVHINDFGQNDFNQLQEETFRGLAEIGILHGRFADNGRRVDRMAAVRDGSQVHHGIRLDGGVVAGGGGQGVLGTELTGVGGGL